MNCFNPVLFLLKNLLINILPLTVEFVMHALSTGCSSFAHHYNLLGEELAICARTAKADWIFHCIHFCGCGRVTCLQKRTSGSKLKKVPTQSLTVLFFSEIFWHVLPYLQKQIRTGEEEKTVEEDTRVER